MSVKEVCQLQTELVSYDNEFHSEDLYFELAESTDEMPTVKNSHKQYVTDPNHHYHRSLL